MFHRIGITVRSLQALNKEKASYAINFKHNSLSYFIQAAYSTAGVGPLPVL